MRKGYATDRPRKQRSGSFPAPCFDAPACASPDLIRGPFFPFNEVPARRPGRCAWVQAIMVSFSSHDITIIASTLILSLSNLILSLSKDHHEDMGWSEKRASRRLCATPPPEDCQKKWAPVFRFGNPTTKKCQCLAQRGFSASWQKRHDPRGKKESEERAPSSGATRHLLPQGEKEKGRG